MEEDWDLQAVVRGGGGGSRSCDLDFADSMMMNSPPPSPSLSFSPLMSFDHDRFQGGGAFGSTTTTTTTTTATATATRDVIDGFEGLYRTFFPVLHHPQPISPQNTVTTRTSMSSDHKELKPNGGDDAALSPSPPASKSKKSKKKIQLKRVVQQVPADGISSDLWAWRKYGQKPIKGSPYPRSYYRCSSLKGCLARKQVERSSRDPSLFIITYTAEHSHALPPRRHSLAGSTRNKSTNSNMPQQAVSNESSIMTPTIKEDESRCSPTNSMSTSNIDQEDHASIIKNEDVEEQRVLKDSGTDRENVLSDIVFSDELFPSLEDLEGILLDQFVDTIP